ncbi:sigma-70 family RNA polymerase sigma factor [Alloacidobacterium dinghuense]|uniref:Sigma-70 family RNA polymerase sigma factor n=1 Tax=Alloacidobacterium dinghuense TaxID=2763107 RepID=A0A7G8BF54_9BACT|nr:ECF-type sigma factor [Alloacidobacterium dinghuense]QNI31174.1 sigma-70 family RNA polymerase sigma factor [Alloacidobacterium dinghuense]
MSASEGDVTALLKAMTRGDVTANEKLLPLVYKELHRLAKSYMRRERRDHTLQPTALINEAYLRLAHDSTDWQSRAHFIGIAANVMRQVLIDHARAHKARVRGGDLQRVEFDEGFIVSGNTSPDLLALDEALLRLEKENPRQAKVVELRYFAGLSVEETARVLGIAPRSVKRDWAVARTRLYGEISRRGRNA